MNVADRKLPPSYQGRIQVLETVLLLLRGSLKHTQSDLLAAYADEIEDVEGKIESLRQEGRRELRPNQKLSLTGERR